MVCYARPATWLAAIVMAAWLVFSRPVGHFLDTAALMAVVTLATAAAAVAAALAFAAFASTRRRRAAAGGCVNCQFRCQHAMTGPPRRLWLVTTVDRRPPGHVSAVGGVDRGPDRLDRGRPTRMGRPAPVAGPPVRPLLPIRPVEPRPVRDKDLERVPAGSAPRWPDQPVHRAGRVSHREPGTVARARARERVGSPV